MKPSRRCLSTVGRYPQATTGTAGAGKALREWGGELVEGLFGQRDGGGGGGGYGSGTSGGGASVYW